MFLVVAIAASLAASLSFAVSAALEQRSAQQVPDRGVFAPPLEADPLPPADPPPPHRVPGWRWRT